MSEQCDKSLAIYQLYRNGDFRKISKNAKPIPKRMEIKARRRARKLNATPVWANQFNISEINHLAKLREKVTGFKWHVDHIVPLVSDKVCGLHWEANLRVIPATLNLKKHNNFIQDQ